VEESGDRSAQNLQVKGREPQQIELRYTVHGPIIYEDRARNRAYALRWVGSEPGTAGYLAGLAVARAGNWNQFVAAMERYKVPSETLCTRIPRGTSDGRLLNGADPQELGGVLPVPGDTGDYEWEGFRRAAELPRSYNPPRTSSLPPITTFFRRDTKSRWVTSWALPFRFHRIEEMLGAKKKLSVDDFERMQQDVASFRRAGSRRFYENDA